MAVVLSKYTPRSQAYWRLTAIVKREEPICWLCGQDIEPWRKKPDPLAFQCDHIKSPKTHPELAEVRSNLHASHAKCNRERERTKTPSRLTEGLYVSLDEF